MAFELKEIALFWDIIHKQEIRKKYPKLPLEMVATAYTAYLVNLAEHPHSGNSMQDDDPRSPPQHLVPQIKFLQENGVFKTYGLSDDVIKEIIEDLVVKNPSVTEEKLTANQKHRLIIQDLFSLHSSKSFTPDVITAFISTLDNRRTQDDTTKLVSIAPRMREHVAVQPSASDYHYKQGVLYQQQGKFAEADISYSLTLKALEQEWPPDPAYLPEIQENYIAMAETIYRNGNALYKEKKFEQASQAYEAALKLQSKALAVNETDQDHHIDIISVYVNLAHSYLECKDFEKTNQVCKMGLEHAQRLKQNSPQNHDDLRRQIADLYHFLYFVQDYYKNAANCFELQKFMVKTMEALTEKNLKDARLLAKLYGTLAFIYLENKKFKNAIICFEKTIQYQEFILEKDPNSKESQPQIVFSCNKLAKIYSKENNLYKVALCYQKAIKNLGTNDDKALLDHHTYYGQLFISLRAWKPASIAFKAALKELEKTSTPDEKALAKYKLQIEIVEKQYQKEAATKQNTVKKRIVIIGEQSEGSPTKKLKISENTHFKPLFSQPKEALHQSVATNQDLMNQDDRVETKETNQTMRKTA